MAATWPCCGPRPRKCEKAMEGVEGVADLKVEMQQTVFRRSKSRWTWRTPMNMASSRATSAGLTATMVAGEEVGDIHIANRTYDVNVWSTPETRNSLIEHPEPADRYAERQDGAAGRRGRCRHQADAQRRQARAPHAQRLMWRERQGRGSRLRRRRCRRGPRQPSNFRSNIDPEVIGEYAERQKRLEESV